MTTGRAILPRLSREPHVAPVEKILRMDQLSMNDFASRVGVITGARGLGRAAAFPTTSTTLS